MVWVIGFQLNSGTSSSCNPQRVILGEDAGFQIIINNVIPSIIMI
jgi:hypothetical protein